MTAGSCRTSSGVPRAITLPSFSTTTRSQAFRDDVEVVVDQDDAAAAAIADAATTVSTMSPGLGVIETCGRLVEQQELQPADDRARDLEPPLQAIGELRREPVADMAGSPAPRRPPCATSRRSPSAEPGGRHLDRFERGEVAGRRMFWKVRRMPRRAATRRVRPRPLTLAQTRSCPAVGCSTPEMTLSSVVLPEPFGPMRPTISPWLEREIDVVDGRQTLEAHDDPGCREQHRCRAMRDSRTRPRAPPPACERYFDRREFLGKSDRLDDELLVGECRTSRWRSPSSECPCRSGCPCR